MFLIFNNFPFSCGISSPIPIKISSQYILNIPSCSILNVFLSPFEICLKYFLSKFMLPYSKTSSTLINEFFNCISSNFLSLSNDNIIISSQESEIGVAKEEMACSFSGEDVLMSLNYTYLEEPIKTITTERIRVDFEEPTKAIILKGVGEDNIFHVIMPMQME